MEPLLIFSVLNYRSYKLWRFLRCFRAFPLPCSTVCRWKVDHAQRRHSNRVRVVRKWVVIDSEEGMAVPKEIVGSRLLFDQPPSGTKTSPHCCDPSSKSARRQNSFPATRRITFGVRHLSRLFDATLSSPPLCEQRQYSSETTHRQPMQSKRMIQKLSLECWTMIEVQS